MLDKNSINFEHSNVYFKYNRMWNHSINIVPIQESIALICLTKKVSAIKMNKFIAFKYQVFTKLIFWKDKQALSQVFRNELKTKNQIV